MKDNVIQFADLADFMKDVHDLNCVRLESIRHNEHSLHDGMVKIDTFGVAVRGINQWGHVLACFIPAYRAQIMADHDEGKELTGWDKANALKTKVRDHLESEGIDVRPGLVWVDPKRLIYGGWSECPQ